MVSMGQKLFCTLDEDEDVEATESTVSIATPCIDTDKLQNGNVLFGGKFLATVT